MINLILALVILAQPWQHIYKLEPPSSNHPIRWSR